MNTTIKLQLDSYTDAAGKYNPKAPRQGNEDSCLLLTSTARKKKYTAYTNGGAPEGIVEAGYDGTVMAVADGMGGMNAGEVASAIAIDVAAKTFADLGTVRDKSSAIRGGLLEKIVCQSDADIKADVDNRDDCDHYGMGSTMILAWLVDNELTVTWIGDSRAYLYRPGEGIRPLSRDHSYVQGLADRGIITYEETFAHPQGNIVTRSLGDPRQPPHPETAQYTVQDGDIIMLCSDGLSGVLRDRPLSDGLPEQTLETIIAAHSDDVVACRRALMEEARKADWYDNVTVMLCRVVSGADAYAESGINRTLEAGTRNERKAYRRYIWALIAFIVCSVIGGYFAMRYNSAPASAPAPVTPAQPAPTPHDSTKVQHVSSTQSPVQTGAAAPKPSARPEARQSTLPAAVADPQQKQSVKPRAGQSAQEAQTPGKSSDKTDKNKAEDKTKPADKARKEDKSKAETSPIQNQDNPSKDKETNQTHKI